MYSNIPKHTGFQSIQCLRAIAALLVVSCHIGSVEQLYTGSHILPEWGKYGVDLFFVISDFVMTYNSYGKCGKVMELRPFLLKQRQPSGGQ